MRNGRAVRSGKPAKCHATDERVLLIGTRSADHIMASGQSGCSNKAEYMTAPDHRESVRFLLHRGRRPYMALGGKLLRRNNCGSNRGYKRLKGVDAMPAHDPGRVKTGSLL